MLIDAEKNSREVHDKHIINVAAHHLIPTILVS